MTLYKFKEFGKYLSRSRNIRTFEIDIFILSSHISCHSLRNENYLQRFTYCKQLIAASPVTHPYSEVTKKAQVHKSWAAIIRRALKEDYYIGRK